MDEQGLYDIYGTWHVPWWQSGWFIKSVWFVVIISSVALISYIIYWYLQKKKKVLLWDDAIAQIGAIADDATSHEQSKKQYLLLTGTLKRYLIKRYGLSIVGSTDAELLEQLKKSELNNSEIINLLQNFFEESSMIKFANAHSDKPTFKSAKARSVYIIKQTIPRVENSKDK